MKQIIRRCIPETKIASTVKFCHSHTCGGHFNPKRTAWKVLECGLFLPSLFHDAYTFFKTCENYQHICNIGNKDKMLLIPILVCEIFDVWGINFMGPFSSSFGNTYILLTMDYVSKWIKTKATSANYTKTVVNFLKRRSL